jgi:hypothetical protein
MNITTKLASEFEISQPVGYFLQTDPRLPPKEVDRQEFIYAERAAWFYSKTPWTIATAWFWKCSREWEVRWWVVYDGEQLDLFRRELATYVQSNSTTKVDHILLK